MVSSQAIIQSTFTATHSFRHGWHSWSSCRWIAMEETLNHLLPLERRIQVDDDFHAYQNKVTSHTFGILKNSETGRCTLLGAISLTAWIVTEDVQTLRGYTTDGSACEWIQLEGSFAEVTSLFLRQWMDAYHLKSTKSIRSPRVWCSWYRYFLDISETILENVLKDIPPYIFDVFQIDDGWQKKVGDWSENEKFSSGLKKLADNIKQRNMNAGIWLAPFLLQPECETFRDHPEWVLKNTDGTPKRVGWNWHGPTYGLDLTHPEVHEWLTTIFSNLKKQEWCYFKLDFLYAGAVEGKRYDQSITREQAYQKGLSVIREAVGPSCYLMACGAPIFPSLGYVNGLRIGPDVSPDWDNLKRSVEQFDLTCPSAANAIRTCSHREWLIPAVDCDPDVVFFRSQQCSMTEDQKQSLQKLAKRFDFKCTSDVMAELNIDEQKKMISFFRENSI